MTRCFQFVTLLTELYNSAMEKMASTHQEEYGSPFNIDVIVDEALGTEGATIVQRESRERDESEEDMGAWEFEEADTDGGEN